MGTVQYNRVLIGSASVYRRLGSAFLVSSCPQGTMVTMDMRMDRVRVFCSPDNVVTRPPRVG